MSKSINITIRQRTGRGQVTITVEWCVDGQCIAQHRKRIRNAALTDIDFWMATETAAGVAMSMESLLRQGSLF